VLCRQQVIGLLGYNCRIIISVTWTFVNIGGNQVNAFSVRLSVRLCTWWFIMQRRVNDVIIAMTSFYSASSNTGIYCYYFFSCLYLPFSFLFSLCLPLTDPCCYNNEICEIWLKINRTAVVIVVVVVMLKLLHLAEICTLTTHERLLVLLVGLL